MEALSLFKRGDYDASAEKMKEGDSNFSKAHSAHLQTLQDEMTLLEPQITLLLTHAEDQLMGAETIKNVVQECMDLYREVRGV